MKNLIFIICILVSTQMVGQKLGYGFKAGLGFSSILGSSEQDDNGKDLETFKYNSGFHIGATVHYTFNDIIGVRTELLFNQRGYKYLYDGSAYQRILLPSNDEIFLQGNKEILLNITNSYIDIPISVFARALPWLEVSTGISFNFMTSSTAAGEMKFKGVTPKGALVDEYTISLDYDYLNDEIGGIGNDGQEPVMITVDGNVISLPKSFGAYFSNSSGVEKPFFNKFEMGLTLGTSIFLNQGLFLGLRAYYGLSDITNNPADPNLFKRNEEGFIFNNDVDKSLSFQASIGFSF